MTPRTPTTAALMAGLLLLPASGTAAAQDSQEGRSAQIAEGAEAWQANCGRCHNLRNIQDQTDEEWDVSVSHMRVRANLPGPVAESIKAFLKSSN